MQDILLIASQRKIKDSFTEMLSPDFHVHCAESTEAGMEFLKCDPKGIVAILEELNLARKSDFAVAKYMKESSIFSLIPMIAISDELPVPEDANCIDHGYFDLITAYAPRKLVCKRINNAIRANESLSLTEIEKMLKVLPACIFLKDTEGRYVFSTQYWRHLDTGGDPNWTIRGKTDLDIRKDRENALKAMEADRRILETGEGTDYIIQENQDGILEYLQLIKRPVYDAEGRISGIIALINNVTEHQLLKMELEKRAKTDALTGLLNKFASGDLVRMILANYPMEDTRCALLMIDVDLFKHVNDTLGHAEGDRVLAEIGRIIGNSCRAMDVAGRIGGDEFMVFMRDIVSPENARQVANRLSRQVEHAFRNDRVKVSLSIGISLFPEHGRLFDALFQAADGALYHVKKHGRNACAFYDPAMEQDPGRSPEPPSEGPAD